MGMVKMIIKSARSYILIPDLYDDILEKNRQNQRLNNFRLAQVENKSMVCRRYY